jgi:4-diphosphocytidyl-2-C-methyl-D-erythritol kinase
VKSLNLTSYAKLNLYLRVLRKRPDNYHSILTLFERISIADQIGLRLIPHRAVKIVASGLSVPLGRDNLVYKVGSLLQKEFKITTGVQINIKKQIPISAGLGGGSSNAAAVLLGLNQLWGLNLSLKQLVGIAGKIGADVPFFLYNSSFAYATSRGDRIKVLELPVELWHVIVVPRIKVFSSLIYKKWDESRKNRGSVRHLWGFKNNKSLKHHKGTGLTNRQSIIKILKAALLKKDPLKLSELLFNSLEQVSSAIYPVIRRTRLAFADAGLKAISMSGSGSAMFGLVSSRKEAYGVARQLRALGNCDVFVAKTV